LDPIPPERSSGGNAHGGGHDDGHGGGKITPPTYFKDNDFTDATKEMVFTYGVPRYQEATPVLFSIVTFPFIFGVMYGDIGHGLCLYM